MNPLFSTSVGQSRCVCCTRNTLTIVHLNPWRFVRTDNAPSHQSSNLQHPSIPPRCPPASSDLLSTLGVPVTTLGVPITSQPPPGLSAVSSHPRPPNKDQPSPPRRWLTYCVSPHSLHPQTQNPSTTIYILFARCKAYRPRAWPHLPLFATK